MTLPLLSVIEMLHRRLVLRGLTQRLDFFGIASEVQNPVIEIFGN